MMPLMFKSWCVPLGTHTTLCWSQFVIQRRFSFFSNRLCLSGFFQMSLRNVTRLVTCLSVGTTRDRTTVGLPVRVGQPCRKTFVLLKVTSESLSLRL